MEGKGGLPGYLTRGEQLGGDRHLGADRQLRTLAAVTPAGARRGDSSCHRVLSWFLRLGFGAGMAWEVHCPRQIDGAPSLTTLSHPLRCHPWPALRRRAAAG